MTHARVSWLLLLLCGSAVAHHGNSEFDLTTTVRYEGTIVEMRWINPHTVTKLETRTATAILRTGGFSVESLPKGERVTAVVSPSRRFPNESAYGYEIIKSDGTVIPLVSARMRRAPTTETTASIFGAWVPTAESFARMARSLGTAALTEEGRALRSRYTPLASGQAKCIPVSAPTVMTYPSVLVLQRSADSVSIKTDWLGAERTVYTDGRAHPPAQDRFPQGHSTGKFEGDVFVIDTANFTDQEAQGVPSGAGKHLVERFALAEGGKSLSYEFVWRDPQFLADALTGTAELTYRPDLEPLGIACDRENAERFFREFQ
jgi:Family of unknown function (DUF6152)